MFKAFFLTGGLLGGVIATCISTIPLAIATPSQTAIAVDQQTETLVSRNQYRPRQSRGTGRREIMTQQPQTTPAFSTAIG